VKENTSVFYAFSFDITNSNSMAMKPSTIRTSILLLSQQLLQSVDSFHNVHLSTAVNNNMPANFVTMPPQDPPSAALEVLDFWYGPLQECYSPSYEHRYDLWFGRGADAEITHRFSQLFQDVGNSPQLRKEWCATPRGTIAYIVLLDQLNRNLHRGTPRMFEHDEKCLEEARRLAEKKQDGWECLAPPELVHLSVCLSHSENIQDHELNIQKLLPALFESFLPEEQIPFFRGHAHMSKIHAQEIHRFGRYPHRNALLNRESTPKEREWLAQSQYGYHQQVKK